MLINYVYFLYLFKSNTMQCVFPIIKFPEAAQQRKIRVYSQIFYFIFVGDQNSQHFKDVRVHAPITWIKLGIPIYFIDHSKFITAQCEKILSRTNNNEIKCFWVRQYKESIKTSLENNYSWIDFNISICSPYEKTWRFYQNKLLYLQNTQTVHKIFPWKVIMKKIWKVSMQEAICI